MEALTRFLDMGGYAAYVWPSFVLTFAVVIGLAVASRLSLRKAERQLALLEQSRPARRARPGKAA